MDNFDLKGQVLQLIGQMHSMQLATVAADKSVEASYTPYLYESPFFYCFISKLANHTTNLIHHPQCSVLIIEDEATCKNLFARTRLMFQCQAELLDESFPSYYQVLDKMEIHLGNTMSLIRKLPDFCLFRLTVEDGRFVKGFGAAYQIADAGFTQIEPV